MAGGLALGALSTLPRPARAAGALPARITDGQVHVWEGGGDRKPSPSGRQAPLLAEELLSILDANGVERAVIVTPSWAPRGNAYSLEAAQTYPDRLKVLGLISMPGEDKRAEVEHWMDPEGMAGMRLFLSSDAGAKYLAEGGADWLWPVLAERGIPVAVHAGDSLPVLAAAAGKYPALKLGLDSFGLGRNVEPAQAAEKFGAVAETMAQYPNVVVKTGAIPRDSGDAFPFPHAQALVRRAYEAFGPERILYASDLTLLQGPYREGLDFWTELDFVSDEDRARILGQNMNSWLGWA
jgi:L-fuconolactonase